MLRQKTTAIPPESFRQILFIFSRKREKTLKIQKDVI